MSTNTTATDPAITQALKESFKKATNLMGTTGAAETFANYDPNKTSGTSQNHEMMAPIYKELKAREVPDPEIKNYGQQILKNREAAIRQ